MKQISVFLKRNLRSVISCSFALLALADIAFLEVTWVSVALLALTFVPWLLPYLKEFTSPLGFSVDMSGLNDAIASLRDMEFSEEIEAGVSKYREADHDLNVISLMRLRRDLEVEARDILERDGGRPLGLSQAILELGRRGYFDANFQSELMAATRIMNAVVHGVPMGPKEMESAVAVGVDALERLGARHC